MPAPTSSLVVLDGRPHVRAADAPSFGVSRSSVFRAARRGHLEKRLHRGVAYVPVDALIAYAAAGRRRGAAA